MGFFFVWLTTNEICKSKLAFKSQQKSYHRVHNSVWWVLTSALLSACLLNVVRSLFFNCAFSEPALVRCINLHLTSFIICQDISGLVMLRRAACLKQLSSICVKWLMFFSVFSLSCNLLGLRLCIPLDPVSSYIAMSFLEKGGLLFFQLKSNIMVNPG